MLDNNDLFKKLKGIFVVSDDNTESSLGGNMNADSKAPTRVSNPMTSIADSASINEKHLQLKPFDNIELVLSAQYTSALNIAHAKHPADSH